MSVGYEVALLLLLYAGFNLFESNLFSLTSEAEIHHFFQANNVKYLALVFENKKSYVGREVRSVCIRMI